MNGMLTTGDAAERAGLTPRRIQQLANALRAHGVNLPQAPYGQGTLWPPEVIDAVKDHKGEALEVLLQDPRLQGYRTTPEPLAAALAVGEVLEVVWGVRHALKTLARNDHFNRWGSVFRDTFGGLE
jgi:LmbE family N-acetylglucosaminyl deacetylase